MRILHIVPYRIYPPRGGGALRAFHMLDQLARTHEVHAIVFQAAKELRKAWDHCTPPETLHLYSPTDTPPPPSVFHRLPARVAPGVHYRWLRRSLRGPADSVLLRSYHLVESILRRHSIDVAIFEELSAMAAAPMVQRLQPDAKRVVNLYNVNHHLLAHTVGEARSRLQRQERRAHAVVRWQEHNLGRFVDAFFACSDEDRAVLTACSGVEGHTVPNGVDTADTAYALCQTEPARNVLFCGSLSYEPNAHGLNWFLAHVWDRVAAQVPGAQLTIVGRGESTEITRAAEGKTSVHLVGEVDAMLPYYRSAHVAIVPLMAGSGTRLKVLEAMSAGTPIVSTAVGTAGINATSGQHFRLADGPVAFSQAIIELLEQPARRKTMSIAARALVEAQYDWNVIGNRIDAALETVVAGGRYR